MHQRQKPSTPEHRSDLAADGGALSMSHNDSRSLFNFSQLVLSAGQIKPSPALKHSKITYFEVEILDVQSKKQICIVDKVPPASTLLDVKHKFHKACNPGHEYRLGGEEQPCGERLGILVNENLEMTWQCTLAAQAASYILGCIKRGLANRSKEVILHLYSVLMRPHLEYKKDADLLEHKMI
ncbi:hypothetical protein WISP_124052 [Willisornis vidua]|uniref:TECR-like N-terminal domain-containing protein n=1 Tax=Willisornis vidua TaxID=1566151 RepID=A0ABQ9CRL1_9PASS|nr:hypothetical protein WISP_124052 [Willisornis vidua]